MNQILVKDEKFSGKYVAISSMEDVKVISSGNDPAEAYEGAVKNGCADPLILYIPKKDMVQIYFVMV